MYQATPTESALLFAISLLNTHVQQMKMEESGAKNDRARAQILLRNGASAMTIALSIEMKVFVCLTDKEANVTFEPFLIYRYSMAMLNCR